MDVNPLKDLLSPQARKIIYAVYICALIFHGALAIAVGDYTGVTKTGDVLQYLGIPVVALAGSNVADVQGKHEA